MKYSPDLLIMADGNRCGWASGAVYTIANMVNFKVPIDVLYFDAKDHEYALGIRKEISQVKKTRMVMDPTTNELVDKRVWVPLYKVVTVAMGHKSLREKWRFLDIELPEGISRPRCPNCMLQGPVIMPDDGYPKTKPYSTSVVKMGTDRNGKPKEFKTKTSEPYCHHCKGRLSLMLPRPCIETPLLTDDELEFNNVSVVGRQNDEVEV